MATGQPTGLTPAEVRATIATLASPDVVESPFGALRFFDGVPLPDTVTTVYDALDLLRAIDVFLNCAPGASLVAFRRGIRSIGITSPQVIGYSDPRANSMGLGLTPNTETTYGTTMLDLRAWGPTVVEAPPGSLSSPAAGESRSVTACGATARSCGEGWPGMRRSPSG